jgi:RHS repeat-associated protein
MPETNFFWEPISDNILQERDEAGVLAAEYTTEAALYGNLVCQHRAGVAGQYHCDAQGSTLAVTDDSQQVTDTRAYTAFGEATDTSGSTSIPFQYIGKKGYYHISSFPQYVARRRPYDTRQGRWLCVDPLGTHLVDTLVGSNDRLSALYVYADNSPLGRHDASGLFSTPACIDDDDPCKECDALIAGWPKEDLTHELTIEGEIKWTCKVTLKCATKCGTGLLGFTEVPKREGRNWAIDICISCTVANRKGLEAVIKHELIHFRSFCGRGRGFGSAQECATQERLAYGASCRATFKGDEEKIGRCIQCGVFLGCGPYFKTGGPRDRTPPCKPEDIGVETVRLE